MKKTFYEVLWAIAKEEKLIDKWIYEEKLLFNGTTYSWTPKALEEADAEEVLGKLQVSRVPGSLKEQSLKEIFIDEPKHSNNKGIVIPSTWLGDFISKFSAKNLGISGKTTDKSSVVKRLIKFLSEYDYTLEEISQATDLCISYMKQQGSIKYIRECGYFIFKKVDGVDQSDLAKWCEELKNGSGPAYNSHQIL
jgi:hypothetical protein